MINYSLVGPDTTKCSFRAILCNSYIPTVKDERLTQTKDFATKQARDMEDSTTLSLLTEMICTKD